MVGHLYLIEPLFFTEYVANGQSPHGDCMYQPNTLLYVWSLLPLCTCCVLRSSPIYSSSAGLFSEPVDVIARESFYIIMLYGRTDGQSHVGPSLVFPPPAFMLRAAMSNARALCFLSVCSLILHGHSMKKCPLPCKPRVCVCSSVVSNSCHSYIRFLLQQAFSWKDLDV